AVLQEGLVPLETRPLGVSDCAGRVLAEDVASPVDVPGFDRSMMDGYALRGEETFGASDGDPRLFELVGEAMPGAGFEGSVRTGQAVRIMTGAPMPEGADAVAMAEVCHERDGRVEVAEAVAPRKNVGARGEDVRSGTVVLRRGRRLRPQDAGLLASIGVTPVACHRRVRVDILVTGNEILPAGERPRGYRIVDSNSPMLTALVARDGGRVDSAVLVDDDEEAIRAVMADSTADVLLVSGGSSVGREDHAPRLLAELGSLDFHGVAMRPSSPAGGGRIGERRVFLLPGNPVSCMCAYEFFAGPTIRVLGGRSFSWPQRRVKAALARKIASQVGRTDYVRVALEPEGAIPVATSGASVLSSTVRADGVVIVARSREGYAEGESVEVLLFDDEVGGARLAAGSAS
ncbi:MAG: gephyrin-like molybdotransferase Glp, partial [Acidobacteriota bacterium]|nr:gephyrin-like molybdotransferase Glp [Acidobacteriota bacterium]